MNKIIQFTFSTTLLVISMSAVADLKWSYVGDGAPDKWAKIHQDYNRCEGFNQSPINITNSVKSSLTPLKISYTSHAQTIVNNGHTVQINFSDGGDLHVDGDVFTLKQFHLHTPSENLINGESFPLEAHFVHINKSGALAVIGVMYKEGLQNLPLAKLWSQLPKQQNLELKLNEKVSATEFLPKDQQYYRFSGSLTTPPCTEGVRWFVFKEVQSASAEQIKAFSALMEHGNSRPVQPLNGRVILESP